MKGNRRKIIMQALLLLFLIAGTVYIASRERNTPYQHDTGMVFGTTYSIIYKYDKSLHTEIRAEMKKVDDALSTFNPTSIISLVNSGQQHHTNKMFDTVFELAERISKDTDGAFDITVAPLVNVWGFGFKSGNMPGKAQVDSLLALVGHDKVSLKDGKVQKADPRVMIDCSAIAKGYGCDVVASLLHSKGIENFMVEIGGEVITRGVSEKNAAWKIGVAKPTDDSLNTNKEIQTILRLNNSAMATSGNYRNFYYKGGKKYAHTIDPRTGYPVQHSLLSATVIADNCATADAYATSFMVMGKTKAIELLRSHDRLMAYLIYCDDKGRLQVWCSDKLKGKMDR